VLKEPPRNRIKDSRRLKPRPYGVRKPEDYQLRKPGNLIQVDTLYVRPLPRISFKHFTAQDVASHWDVIGTRSRATASTTTDFLDEIVGRMPFLIKTIQVDGDSEFMAEFEVACSQCHVRLFILPPPKLNGQVEPAHRTHIEEFYEV
jgi:putative transposase